MTAPLARLAAASLLIALAGCTGLQGAPTPANVLAAATVTKSIEEGGKFIALVGPRRPHAAPFLGVPDTNFDALRSWLDTRTGETAHQLYVEDSYFGAERNWEAARIQAGPVLRFIPISKNKITCENGCSYAEEFAAALPEALLRASPSGLAISFTAHTGAEQTILVPGELIARQLAAVDTARATLPTAAALPPANPVR
jgi:hypothetical protein